MTKSNFNKTQQTTAQADGKKSVPINHMILKRVNDVKAMVSGLAENSHSESAPDRQLTSEIQRQSTDISEIKEQLQQFQQILLTDFCDALATRIANNPTASRESIQSDSEAADDPDPASAGLKEDTWANIRSAFLNGNDVGSNQSTSDTAGENAAEENAAGENAAGENAAEENAVDDDLGLLEIQDYEVVSDLSTLDNGQLRDTVESQEQVISILTRKLRTRQNSRPTMTEEQLAAVQELAEDELAAEIRETLSILRDLQREGELELSLERARLSRRRTKLDQLAERIEGRARTLGVTITEDGMIEDGPAADRGTGSQSRRWLGAMGFGKT